MIWKRKPKIAATDVAEGLVNEFVPSAAQTLGRSLMLSDSERIRFNHKISRYALASVLMAVIDEGQANSQFNAVRIELESRILGAAPTDLQSSVLAQLKDAMNDLCTLLSPMDRPKEMSWARNWLLEIGIDESNPVTLGGQAAYWLDFYATAVKLLRSFTLA